MKITAIKLLCNDFSLSDLDAAETAIYEESVPIIDIPGEDEGEQLTHILAAKEIMHEMASTGIEFNKALRNYTLRVRNSIG